MTCWIVIPAKAPSIAKGRLAEALPNIAREALASAMLDHVIRAVMQANTGATVAIVGAAPAQLAENIITLPEPGGGLNSALASVRQSLAGQNACRMISLAADLPLLEPSDVLSLLALPPRVVGIAPDRHGTGTNALSLPLPQAADFTYSYGPGSFDRHVAEARRLHLEFQTVVTPGLARDIDEPADLGDITHWLAGEEGQA